MTYFTNITMIKDTIQIYNIKQYLKVHCDDKNTIKLSHDLYADAIYPTLFKTITLGIETVPCGVFQLYILLKLLFFIGCRTNVCAYNGVCRLATPMSSAPRTEPRPLGLRGCVRFGYSVASRSFKSSSSGQK